MLRRHCWLKPANTSSSERSSNGMQYTYRGCTSPNPAPELASCCQPPARSASTTWLADVECQSAATRSNDAGAFHASDSASASAFFTVPASHLRDATGGPIFTWNAPTALQCSSNGCSHSLTDRPDAPVQSSTGPSGI